MANNIDAIKRGWHYNAVSGNLEAYNNGNEIFQYPYGTNYYVSKSGADTNSGLSWAKGFLTISAAMTAAATVGTAATRRGGVKIYVAPGGYTEDITTPTNAQTPFGQLVAINPTQRSVGAAYLTSATATEPVITVLARGWLIDGFEVDAPATDGCIMLSGAGAKFTEMANLLLCGSASASSFGVDTTEATPLVVIRDSYLYQFTGGRAITSTNVYCLQWEVARCVFWNNLNHIAPKNSKGWQAGWIHDSLFTKVQPIFTTALMIDMRGGSTVHVGPNNFLGGTYDNAGGYYAGTGDFWRGNHSEDSENGSAQANPA